MQERAIFENALKITDPHDRATFLNEECGDDVETRRNIDRLLTVQSELGDFLESPAAVVAEAVAELDEPPGTQIGPYTLQKVIGVGGFGVVYLADQSAPVKRRVALKIVKPGMDSREVLSRFVAERQALALMDHPGIARVLDAGATDSGRPYFVMELIKGISVTEYCDQNRLAMRDRLQLFLRVCHAIQHAHQKGIIHRDIKPNNVLVTVQDGEPVPKVIDFGVAKAINQQLTDQSVITGFAHMIGTPPYMSPEQAELSPLDVDTRSDIYSLGVLLYELLTGSTPFERERLKSVPFDEVRRIIREEDPQAPSARIGTMCATAVTVAERRGTEACKLQQFVNGDLDWISLKALEKDRTRRYESADSLAQDIQRFLNDEPVDAHPPSTTYRLKKLALQNKRGVVTATLLGTALILATVVSTWQAIEASRAQQSAQTEAATAQAVVEFINEDLLAPASPWNQPDRKLTVREALDRASTKIEGRFADRPLIEAAIRHTLGTSYYTLGEYAESEMHLSKAVEVRHRTLGPEHTQTLASMTNLASALFGQGHYVEAGQLNLQILGIRQRLLGSDHRDTLISKMNLAGALYEQGRREEAEQHYQEILHVQRVLRNADHPELLKTMMNLAIVARNQGDYSAAEESCRAIVDIQRRELGQEHPDTLATMTVLANSLLAQGRYAEAEKLHKEVLGIRTRVLGAEHPVTLDSMNDLALAVYDQGRYDEAEESWRRVLETQRRNLGLEHPSTLQNMMNLANAVNAGGDHAESMNLHRQVHEVRRRTLGPEHPDTLNSALNLANSVVALKQFSEAEELYRDVLGRYRQTVGEHHPATLRTMSNLAVAIHKQGRFTEAERLRRDVTSRQSQVLGATHPATLASRLNLANSIAAQGRSSEAEQHYRDVLTEFETVLGKDHPSTLKCMMALSRSIETQGRRDEAIESYRQVLQRQLRVLGTDHPDTRYSRNALARLGEPCTAARSRGDHASGDRRRDVPSHSPDN